MVTNLKKYNYIIKHIFIFFMAIIPFMQTYQTAKAETIIQDDADIITDNEEKELNKLCDRIFKKYNTSVYIWTDNNISGSDDFGYMMEQFVAAKPFKDVIILMAGMYPGDRIYEVQAYGIAQDMINNKRCSKILDYMYDDMSSGSYYSAMQVFCNKSYTYMGRPPKLDSIIFSPVFQLVICLISGIIIITIISYNSGGRTTTNSNTYLDINNSRIIGSFDRYTHTTIKRTQKPRNNSSGGSSHSGSNSSHSSGGGRSF